MDHLELHVRVRPHLRAAMWFAGKACGLARRFPRLRWAFHPIAHCSLLLMILLVKRLGGLVIHVPDKKP